MIKNILVFFSRNKLKVFFLVFIISIAVLAGIVTGSIFKSFADTRLKTSMINDDIMTINIYKDKIDSFEKYLYEIKTDHFEEIDIYKFKSVNLSYKYFRSSEGTFQAIVGKTNRIEGLIDKLGINLTDGNLFKNGQLVASEGFLDSHGLWIGDFYKPNSDFFYNNELKISGVLDNTSLMAFIDESYIDDKDTYNTFLILGNEMQFKAIEKSIRSSDFMNNNIYIKTPETIRRSFFKRYFSYIFQNIFMNILIAIIFILGIVIFFSYFLKDQYKEISLLHAFGYTKKYIILKNIFQYSIISITGWLLGILISKPFLSIIEKQIFNDVGMFIKEDISIYITSVLIPLFIILYIFYKSKKIIKGNIFNLVKKMNVKDEINYKNEKFVFFKYLQRSGNFKYLFISNLVFIFLIVFFTSLSNSNYQVQLNNIEYFKGKTFVTQENIEFFEQKHLDDLENDKIIPVTYEEINYKLPFGTQKIYNLSNTSLADLEDSKNGYIILKDSLGNNFINYKLLKKQIEEDNYFMIFIGNIINTIIIFVSILINIFIIIKNTLSRKQEIALMKIFGFQNLEVVLKLFKEYLYVYIISIISAIISLYFFWQLFEFLFIKEHVNIFKINNNYLYLFIFSIFILGSYVIPIYFISKNKSPTDHLK
ncbi:MAG: ABC transporter permease [Thermotogota bacterium]